ncbi:hypothetical protein [Clostridium botulinum]
MVPGDVDTLYSHFKKEGSIRAGSHGINAYLGIWITLWGVLGL